ncbi:FtsX-like permease family protein [Olivibacter sp. CPCC 100613]|uniref:ABC transporter permease n=1 Tax=Olivibacter sp. CPCC 100613 TaxID=3079931 RepID=UPI002FFCE2D2
MLKTIIRQLWYNKLFTSLHILGLSIGISACFIIYQLVGFEFGFERAIPNHERIFNVVSHLEFNGEEGHNVGVPKPLGKAVETEVPGVKFVVPVAELFMEQVVIPQRNGERKTFKSPDLQVMTQSSFFEMLPYQWLTGNAKQALDAPNKVVLTKSRAEKYFPGFAINDIMGKTLVYNDSISKEVSGIVNDLDFATSFYAKEFFTLPKDYPSQSDWGSTNSSDKLYIQLEANSSVTAVQQKINALSVKNTQEQFAKWRFRRDQRLIPITAMHFRTEYGENNVHKANKPVLLGLIGVAVFLLILAIINFINLSTAQLPKRGKEIAVRKTMGSSGGRLIYQFLGETFVTCLLAAFVSCFFTYLFLRSFQDLFPEHMHAYSNYYQIFVLFWLFLGLTTLCAGLYPSWLSTRVNPIQILRNQSIITIGNVRLSLRKTLIVFQFIIAMLFIVCAIIVGEQLRYTLHKDLGFNKKAILLVNIPWRKVNDNKGTKYTFLNELKNLKGIETISLAAPPLSSHTISNNYDYIPDDGTAKKELQPYIKNIDTAYLELYNMHLLAGRNLLPLDTVKEYLINETMSKILGFKSPKEAIGKFIGPQDHEKHPIVGVVKDFHNKTFYSSIDPIILLIDKQLNATYNIKLTERNPDGWQESIGDIEKLWKKFYPADAFEYKFYDKSIEELYTQERNMSKIINLSTFVAILISSLGLLGLITLTAHQRTKEIGIRKVLGASISGIVTLLSKDFLKLVIYAILIATPIAWWAMTKWLQRFTYSIEIQWWIFALAGLMAIGIAFFTMSVQAIKAAKANPVDSLRNE